MSGCAGGVCNGVATLIGLAVYIVVLGAAGLLLLVGISSFLRDLPSYADELQQFMDRLMTAIGGDPSKPLVDPAAVAEFAKGIAQWSLGGLVMIGYSVPVVAYLLLKLHAPTTGCCGHLVPAPDVLDCARLLANRLRTFVVARAFLGAIAAILDVILLLVLGVPAALLWGLLSFLLAVHPQVVFTVLIPPTILALLIGGPMLALAVIALLRDQSGHRLRHSAALHRRQCRHLTGHRDRLDRVLGRRPGRRRRATGRSPDPHCRSPGRRLRHLATTVPSSARASPNGRRAAGGRRRRVRRRASGLPGFLTSPLQDGVLEDADGDRQAGPRVGADVAPGAQLTGTARFKSSA